MKVYGTKSNGVYESVDDYFETIIPLWIAMTFAEGNHVRKKLNI